MTPDGEREADVQGHIYLLHFTQPVAHAQHYLGWAKEGGLFRRLAQHESANGAASPLVKTLLAQGGGFFLARTWTGSKHDERRLKNRRNAAKLCPVCRGDADPVALAPGRVMTRPLTLDDLEIPSLGECSYLTCGCENECARIHAGVPV